MALNISACIIAKNEEKNLPRLLESLKGKFDEIILVDTGSTDRTVDIAKQYGCKIYHRKWQGFADARNYAVSKASGEWIWHFDADFELEEEEWRKALYYLNNIPEDILAVNILIKNIGDNLESAGISSNTFIHRNNPKVKWIGKVHETLNVSESYGIPVFVKHYGFQDSAVLRKKALRNIKLLRQELKELDKSSKQYHIKLFYLVQSYAVLSSYDAKYTKQVIKYATKFINEITDETRFFDIYVYVYLIEALLKEERYDEALKKVKEAQNIFTDYLDIVFLEGKTYLELKNYNRAVESFLKFITLTDQHLKNPFILSKGHSFVSDKLLNLPYYIENIIPETVKKSDQYNLGKLIDLWKKRKGEYLGILIVTTAKELNQDISKFLNKFVNLYNNSPKALSFALLYAEHMGYINIKNKIIKRLQKVDPQNSLLYYFSGKEALEKGKYETAFKDLITYFRKTKDLNIIPKIRECLINLNLKEELKKFDEEINNLTKKLKTTSDNKTQQKQNRR
ncbi:glycosyltransferase family 2 protein [Persephonella sp.]|uniref:tetratricopeptide repeat-containing glycosyltransferase family 2 protein n=1 Tax=Persephonella sp. TaxID=2060922 RepID=UPI0026243BD9|nr:glycosyltransferase family 2 protein [Persephonella sp.]